MNFSNVLQPLAASWAWLKPRLKEMLHIHKHLNFIMYHYIYLVSMTIVGSIILFPQGNLDYIDALFFAAGGSTQSGLNTVDLNQLKTYQQVTLMLIACVCNPIFINLVVVFIRLHWFEKRFEHIVSEQVNARKTKSKSRSKSEAKADDNPSRLEMGVAGRPITVLHETTKPNGMSGSSANTKAHEAFVEKLGFNSGSESTSASAHNSSEEDSGESSSDATARDREDSRNDENEKPLILDTSEDPTPPSPQHHLGLNSKMLNRGITFADELPRPASQPQPRTSSERIPRPRETPHHVAFVQKQKNNAKEGAPTLRIPGPRGFDRGEMPEQLDDGDGGELARRQTRNTLYTVMSEQSQEEPASQPDEKDSAADRPRRGITIDVPDHPAHRQREKTFEDNEAVDNSGSRFGLAQIVSSLRHRRTRIQGVDLEGRKSSMGRTFSTMTTARSSNNKMEDPMPYLSWQPTLGRNSAFVNLTEEQREELGGIEYRALKLLARILMCYYIGNHLLGLVVFLPWITNTNPWREKVIKDGVDPAWWGVFTPASMFNDLGYTLTPDSMYGFNTSSLVLALGSGLIIIGNTGFPVYLRGIIWTMAKLVPSTNEMWEELRFLLDHPRRCFTLLFPSSATWWLFWILVLLNGVDLILFIILDLNDPTVTSIPKLYRVLDGWFQATSTRTAGFAVVNLADLHPAVQVSYMIMMYISVFPIAISVRRTNVYEEKSLGIWGGEDEGDEQSQSYVGQHLRRQLSFDLWFVFLGLFIICIVEGGRLGDNGEYAFTMFTVLFEIVSAYGTVGLSLGYPGINASFSAELKTISKLVIIAMMLRGRHRGLPYALDRAVLLPSENLNQKETEDANLRHERRNTMFSEVGPDEHLGRRGTRDTRATRDDPDFNNAFPRFQSMSEEQDPMSMGAGFARSTAAQRRNSGFSTVSQMDRHRRQRSRSIGRIVASGLSAGPTFSKTFSGRQQED